MTSTIFFLLIFCFPLASIQQKLTEVARYNENIPSKFLTNSREYYRKNRTYPKLWNKNRLSVRFQELQTVHPRKLNEIKVCVKSVKSSTISVNLFKKEGKVLFVEKFNEKYRKPSNKHPAKLLRIPAGQEICALFYIYMIDEDDFELEAFADDNESQASATWNYKVNNDQKIESNSGIDLENVEKKAGKFFDLRFKKFGSFYFSNDDSDQSAKTVVVVNGNLLGEKLKVNANMKILDQEHYGLLPASPYMMEYLKSIGISKDSFQEKLSKSSQKFYDKHVRNAAWKNWKNNEFSSDVEYYAFILKFLGALNGEFESRWINIGEILGAIYSKEKLGSFGDGSIDDQVALSAFVASSILENFGQQNNNKVKKALKFIQANIRKVESDYTIAIAAYTFSLSREDKKYAEKLLDKLMKKSLKEDDGKVHWKGDKEDSKEIKTAAYAILAHSNLEKLTNCAGIMKWLASKQQRHSGAFSHKSIDTMISFQAGAEMAKHLFVNEFNLKIKLATDGEVREMVINDSNKNQEQKIEFSSDGGVSVNVEGFGVANVEVYYVPLGEQEL